MRATGAALILSVLIIMAAVAYSCYQAGKRAGEKVGWRQDRIDLLVRLEQHGVLGDSTQEREVFDTIKQLLLKEPDELR